MLPEINTASMKCKPSDRFSDAEMVIVWELF